MQALLHSLCTLRGILLKLCSYEQNQKVKINANKSCHYSGKFAAYYSKQKLKILYKTLLDISKSRERYTLKEHCLQIPTSVHTPDEYINHPVEHHARQPAVTKLMAQN